MKKRAPIMWIVVGLLELVMTGVVAIMILISSVMPTMFLLFACIFAALAFLLYGRVVDCMLWEEENYGC